MDDQDKYLMQVFKEVKKLLPGLEMDLMSAIWSIDVGEGHVLYCTPFYEECEGIALAVCSEDGETLFDEDLPFNLYEDEKIDALEFVKQIRIWLLNNLDFVEV